MSHKPTILVIDDTESNLDMLMAILKNYDVIPALSGKEALEIVKNEKIDLILLDIMMPEMDGYEVCRRLKSEEATRSIPIIFITAKTDEESIELGYSIGGIDYVTKPFKPRELLARAKTQLDLKGYQESLEAQVESEISQRLAQEKMLIQNAKLAEMGEMMGAIAHQWKQPISAISLFVMNLESEAEQGKLSLDSLREMASKINHQLLFLSETIDDFRHFFKPDKERVLFDLKDEVKRVIDILAPQLLLHKIEVKCEIENHLLEGYKNEFKQVVLNLINNSKDAIIEHGIEGFIRLYSRIEGEFLALYVEDNGGGIAPEMLDQIFTPHHSTKGETGTGIGLSLAKKIITEHHQGEISFSNTDQGALFRVALPKSYRLFKE